MAKALYRKYRPCSLSDVIGQSQVTDVLANSLTQNKISHAYLFIGPRGTGKTSVARIFAHEINGFKYEIEDDYVDIIEIDGASNRGIDDIRELREKALVAPTSGKYKIYIIDEVHMLTPPAFNALLKTLEEPPKHVIFIMATTEAHKVPVTITSRSQIFTFRLADFDTMLEFVKDVAKKENIKADQDALEIIVKRGGGSFRDTLSLLDQVSTLSDKQITKDLIVSALGLPDDEKIKELLTIYLDGDVVKITTMLKNLLVSGVKAEVIAEEIISYIIDNPRPEFFALLGKLPEVKAPFSEAKLLVALSSSSNFNPAPVASPEPRPAVTKPRPDESQKTPSPDTSNASFDIESFIERTKASNDTVYLQLKKSELIFENSTLHIYPATKICETILTSKNNKLILNKFANSVSIEIHKHDEKPKNTKNDKILDKISDIMGGEVINHGGENPFGS